jgi:hypothetical protein
MTRRLFWSVAVVAFVLAAKGSVCWAAGNVTAGLVDHILYVLGDNEGNVVTITGDPYSCTLTVGGDLTESVPLDEVEAVFVDTGGDGDVVYLQGTIPGDVMISTGAGGDGVYLMSLTVLGDISIETGQGGDAIKAWSLILDGSLNISTGQGMDYILLGPSEIGGSLHVNTGVNLDQVVVDSPVTVGGDLLLDLGQGDDVLTLSSFGVPVFPLVAVGGGASLHGDQGFDRIDKLPWSLEKLIAAKGGLEVVGFESPEGLDSE